MSPCCNNTAPGAPDSASTHTAASDAGSDSTSSVGRPSCCNSQELCDEKCIEFIATAECQNSCDDHAAHQTRDQSTDEGKPPSSSACHDHLKAAFDQYSKYLEQARCICRSMTVRGLPMTCCEGTKKTPPKKAKATAKPKAVPASTSTPTTGGCCSSKKPSTGQSLSLEEPPKGGCCSPKTTSTAGGNCTTKPAATDECCSSEKPSIGGCSSSKPATTGGCCAPKTSPVSEGCCSGKKPSPSGGCCSSKTTAVRDETGNGVGGGCVNDKSQADDTIFSPAQSPPSMQAPIQSDVDMEKNSTANLEQVSVSVSGMTCTGCGSKLDRVIKAQNGVRHVEVNFVTGLASFSFDRSQVPSGSSTDDLIREVAKKTGFGIVRIRGHGNGGDDDDGHEQHLDVYLSRAAARALSELCIPGILDVTPQDKKVSRVSFDASILGARDLLDKIKATGLVGPDNNNNNNTAMVGNHLLAPPREDPTLSNGRKDLIEKLSYTTAAAVLTIPVLVLAWGSDSHSVNPRTKAIVSLVLATLVQGPIAGPMFYKPALTTLIRLRELELDMLVVISITAAYGYSVVAFGFLMAGRQGELKQDSFFETSTLLITLVLVGRLVASYARVSAASAAVSVRSLEVPTTFLVVRRGDGEEGEEVVEMDTRLLHLGDRFRIAPHSLVPTDGVVVGGTSELDESVLTGESAPVLKSEGDDVLAGTLNSGGGPLVVEVKRLPGRNTVADIARLVRDAASSSRPKVQEMADRVAGWFIPVVAAVTVITLVVWSVVVRQPARDAVPSALTYAIAVLAVSCPCALGLAVPMVLVVAGGMAARRGVVVKSSVCLERARLVTDVVLDKTGTVTEPDLRVVSEEYMGCRGTAVRLTKALVAGNGHPVSTAVAAHLEAQEQEKKKGTSKGNGGESGCCAPSSSASQTMEQQPRSIPGAGVEATLPGPDGIVLRAGHPQWTNNEDHPAVQRVMERGMTPLLVTRQSSPLAVYGLSAQIRQEAVDVVRTLKEQHNITVHLVSGDQEQAVLAAAEAIGIADDRDHVRGRMRPEEKRDYVQSLMEGEGHQQNQRGGQRVVLFCGDGTNDAIAVAQADIGVQLSDPSAAGSSDVTKGAADIILLGGRGLRGIPYLLNASRASYHRIVFSFVWAGLYNVLAIALAAGVFQEVGVRIAPAYAGLGEIVSVLPVIIAAATMFIGGDY